MGYAIITSGESRSFPPGDAFLSGAVAPDAADILIHCGTPYEPAVSKAAVLIELGHESLGQHTGEAMGGEGSNVLGFARYRNGRDAPSNLVELVRQDATVASAIEAARAMFGAAGFTVALCTDQAGRIIDRLVRPKYNVALRFLDEGLATQRDMDITCRLGLGYPDGPIERVVRGGLDLHYEITKALFETYGSPGYAPARRAVVAATRNASALDRSASPR
jgi:3-hydroxybutyryl-CoA dehydrogenase